MRHRKTLLVIYGDNRREGVLRFLSLPAAKRVIEPSRGGIACAPPSLQPPHRTISD